MRIPVTVMFSVLISTGMLQTLPSPPIEHTSALPDRNWFMTHVRPGIKLDDELQKNFTYIERRRDVKVSALGKVSVGPLRTFEVYPPAEPGPVYKRLTAIDGVPLEPAELKRRDTEHQSELENEVRKQRREPSPLRAAQLERTERERRDNLAKLEDALAVFEPTVAMRDIVDGEPTIVVDLTPRASARVTTREGAWMKQFEGRAWFVEVDGQLARLDMHATDDVSIGWGIVGRLHKGSRIVVERRRVGAVWLPARLSFDATGRTLLFRTFELNLVRDYTDYKRK